MNTNLIAVASLAAASGAVAGGIAAAGFVNLQDSTPGATQAGHTNITGYSLAGRFGAGVSPTLAKVQVKETGGLQGVRAETNTGVALFGKSTAGTGLGAGGYFTTSSVGGRGIVGDALSSTGNTVGGLFYNRSTGGGVAVWGRAIGAGTATGVFGEVLSANGTALAASNSAAGNSLTAGTANDSLQTVGAIPRHTYSAGAPRSMVPIAYGQIFGTSTQDSSGNFTVANPSTGVFEISVVGFNPQSTNSTILVTSQETAAFQGATFSGGTNGADFNIYTFDQAGNPVDTDVCFVVFMSVPTLGPVMPEDLRNPPGLKRFKGDDEAWAKADPKGFSAWLRRYRAWQVEAANTPPYAPPVDQEDRP